MAIKGKLLLVLFTVAGTISEPQDDLNDQKIPSLELSRADKNYNHPPRTNFFYVSDTQDIVVKKVRDAVDKSDNIVTKSPLQTTKVKRRNAFRGMTNVESSLPEKIPVTVVFDPEPITQRDKNKAVKSRKQPKHPHRSNTDNKSEAILTENKVLPKTTLAVTERNPITSPAPRTIVPKIFTKRPPEDNPVFKKIRQRDPVVKIVEEKNFVFSHSGNFHFSFEGGDGTKVSSEGELKTFDNNKTGEAVVGSVFYKDDEGNDVSLSYTADENGYRPHGAHLPTPPPIPPEIARALKYLATATTPEPVTRPTTKDN